MVFFNCSSRPLVEDLFESAGSISQRRYNRKQIQDLPEPVQKYFDYALTDGQPYVSYLRLKHGGRFKTAPDKDWMDIQGQQYFIAEKPGFVWSGKTKMFRAEDAFVNGHGHLKIYLLSFLRIINQEGRKTDQGELLRWLGESVWLPTNLLPSENKKWTAIDANTARLTLTGAEHEVYYDITFNDQGQIVEMETQRFKGEESKETWIGRVGEYVEVEGMRVPSRIKGIWRLDSGDYHYADFKVEKFEYGVPQPF